MQPTPILRCPGSTEDSMSQIPCRPPLDILVWPLAFATVSCAPGGVWRAQACWNSKSRPGDGPASSLELPRPACWGPGIPRILCWTLFKDWGKICITHKLLF